MSAANWLNVPALAVELPVAGVELLPPPEPELELPQAAVRAGTPGPAAE
jgi:hypothetical protein